MSLKLDVYSFGIILWELIARELPFQVSVCLRCSLFIVCPVLIPLLECKGMTLKEMVEAVSKHDLRPDIPDTCGNDLRAVITGCVNIDCCIARV